MVSCWATRSGGANHNRSYILATELNNSGVQFQMIDKRKCSRWVYSRESFLVPGHQCTRNAKVERDGNWYCKQHDPVEIKRRGQESSRRARAVFHATMRVTARRNAEQAACEDIPDEALEGGLLLRLWQEHCRRIAYEAAASGEPIPHTVADVIKGETND